MLTNEMSPQQRQQRMNIRNLFLNATPDELTREIESGRRNAFDVQCLDELRFEAMRDSVSDMQPVHPVYIPVETDAQLQERLDREPNVTIDAPSVLSESRAVITDIEDSVIKMTDVMSHALSVMPISVADRDFIGTLDANLSCLTRSVERLRARTSSFLRETR